MAPAPIDPTAIDPTPWRNGAGTTREVGSLVDADGMLQWRVSVAELTADAPFSVFTGLDRLFVALGPVRLDVDGAAVDLSEGDQLRFAGEAVVHARVAAPARALNVMTRRGAWCADVVPRSVGAPAAEGAGVSVLVGRRVLDVVLAPGDGRTRG